MNTMRRHWRPLLGLTAAVAMAHLWLLHGAAGRHQVPPAAGAAILLTRTIAASPPVDTRASATALGAAPPTTPAPSQRRAARSGRDPSAPAPLAAAPAAAIAQPIAAALPAAPAREAGALNVAVPASVRLHYLVTARRQQLLWHGQGELDWRHDGERYEAKLELSAPLLPKRTQRSSGNVTPQGLEPVRFSDKARSEQAAHFERDKGRVTFSSNRPDAALMAGAQDRLSVMLQLGAIIAGDPQKYRQSATIELQTAGTHEAEPWQFTIEGEELLELPGGAINAIKLIRHPRKEYDQRVELWLSPGMDYVPVRLRLTQPNGDWVDQQWSSTDKG